MSQIPHPGSFIASEITDIIRNNAAEAEKLIRLHDRQLEVIYRENWFNLFVPKIFGGLELSFPEALRVEEALAWADGSTGWTVTLCSGANWFIGFLDAGAGKEIFANPKSLFGRKRKGYWYCKDHRQWLRGIRSVEVCKRCPACDSIHRQLHPYKGWLRRY